MTEGRLTLPSLFQRISILFFLLFIIILCVQHRELHLWRSEDNFVGSVFSFHLYILFRNGTGVPNLPSENLYSLAH